MDRHRKTATHIDFAAVLVLLAMVLILACLICAATCVWPNQPTFPQLSATEPSDFSDTSGHTQTTAPFTHPPFTGITTVPTMPGVTTFPTVPTLPTLPTLPTEPSLPTIPVPPVTTQPIAPPATTLPPVTTAPTEPPQTTVPPQPFDVDKFFSESAFIGDSVTLALRNYNLTSKALGDAKILCAGSYAVRHAIDTVGGTNVISITYQGQKMRPEDALAAAGVKRVFIMLGLNDIALVGIDKTISNWGKLVDNIRSKCPDIEIYIQSGTPIQIGGEKGSLNNANMDKYNVQLQQFCADNGCYFVNVAETLKNAQGGLREDYCSDDYCHLTNSGVIAWIQYLKDYAVATHGE